MTAQHHLQIAKELSLAERSVAAVIKLLDEGATVPFIARYRKEATAGLDEVAIRDVRDRQAYLKELDARRKTIRDEITKQGKMTPALERGLATASTKAALEDLYAPFKGKRRTRAVMAKERGLGPLAESIWRQDGNGSPRAAAGAFVDAKREVPDVDAALAGARDICAERVADHAEVRQVVREIFAKHGHLEVRKKKAHRGERTKFDDYEKFDESLRHIAPHRYLAIRRGENEGVLRVAMRLDDDDRLKSRIARIAGVDRRSPWARELETAVDDGYSRLLAPRTSAELRSELKERAERSAVDVFAKNLSELLLAAPFGAKTVLGIDPGQRTGCKCAVVSATGELLEHDTMYLVQGASKEEAARELVRRMCQRHRVVAVAVGNGTHGRETEAFVREALADREGAPMVVSVSESGASVYSASDVARAELPDVDLTVRGAVSIARRLQDPLAELVKIDPKSIGVGQYQHDVQPALLSSKLDEVVEDCVNGVGVDLNTASVSLLSHVAGLGPKIAQRVVKERHRRGGFAARKQLLDVSGLGAKTFEQAAGFLRIRSAKHPLDASAVHPERYALVERMARDLGVPLADLVGNAEAIARLQPERYVDDDVGRYTIDDIIAELHKPGRDPRATFAPPKFRDDVRTLDDVREGMQLEGVVTNVTTFGAFVDVGVKQDGLVHISQLADRFVRDPNEVVHVGSKLTVRVLSVDRERKRISLSAKSDAATASGEGRRQREQPRGERPREDRGRRANQGGRSGGGRDRGGRKQGGSGQRGSGQRGSGRRGSGQGGSRGNDDAFSNRPFAKGFGKKR